MAVAAMEGVDDESILTVSLKLLEPPSRCLFLLLNSCRSSGLGSRGSNEWILLVPPLRNLFGWTWWSGDAWYECRDNRSCLY